MRVKEAADRLKVGVKTVYAMVAAGKLRCRRVGMGRGSIRISEEHVEEYLKAAEQGPLKAVAPARAPQFNLKNYQLLHLAVQKPQGRSSKQEATDGE